MKGKSILYQVMLWPLDLSSYPNLSFTLIFHFFCVRNMRMCVYEFTYTCVCILRLKSNFYVPNWLPRNTHMKTLYSSGTVEILKKNNNVKVHIMCNKKNIYIIIIKRVSSSRIRLFIIWIFFWWWKISTKTIFFV